MTEFAFEEISEDDLKKETAATGGRGKGPKYDDSDRSQTGWFKLPHVMGFCTVPKHDEVQQLIFESGDEDAIMWRTQQYPNRMTYLIDPYRVCRDCYTHSADIESRSEGLLAVVFNSDD